MIAAIVVHDAEQRNPVVRGGPQDGRRIVEVAIGLDVNREAAMLSVGKSGTYGRRRAIPHATPALPADVVVDLIHLPQSVGPVADKALGRDQRPVFVLYESPQLHRDTGKADGAGIPTEAGQFDGLFANQVVGFNMFGAACLESAFAVRRDSAANFFNQRGQSCFGIGGNGVFGVPRASVDVEIMSGQQFRRANADCFAR
jgi:hypothetical protein